MNKKRICSLILSLCMIVSMMPTFALADTSDAASIRTQDTIGTSKGVADADTVNYMTDEQYSALGFQLSNPEEFSSDVTTNPLEDYKAVVISELYIGTVNRDATDKDNEGHYKIAENVENVNSSALSLDTMAKTTIGSEQKYNISSSMKEQCVNTIAISTDDLTAKGTEVKKQAYVENMLYYDTSTKKSMQRLTVYTLGAESQYQKGSSVTIDLTGNGDKDWIQDVTIREQGGLTAMAVGDYDHDNYQEVAVFTPTTKYDNKNEGVIQIYKLQKQTNGTCNLTKSGVIKISDFAQRGVWTDNEIRPLVNLTTTSMSGQDDLVVNMTQPYDDCDKACNCGGMVIYRYNNSNKTYERVFTDSLVMGQEDARFTMQSAINADIDGNGEEELVVAGYNETGYNNTKHKRGTIDKFLVNVLLYNQSANAYYWAYSENTVKSNAIKSHSKIDVSDLSDGEMDPVTLTAANYDPSTIVDTVFCEGVLLDFVCGSGNTVGEQITNGKFTRTKEIPFAGDTEEFIGTQATGHFNGNDMESEQTVVVTGHNAMGGDTCDLDIVWIYYADGSNTKETGLQMQVTNEDYFNNVDEDDNGTAIVLTAINADEDSSYIKYTGKKVGWSSPNVLAVLMAPPYYEELDYGTVATTRGTTSYTVTSSATDSETKSAKGGLSLGGSISAVGSVGAAGTKMSKSLGISFGFTGEEIRTYQISRTITKTHTFTNINGLDSVALVVTPLVCYYYDIYIPRTATQEDVEEALKKDPNSTLKVGEEFWRQDVMTSTIQLDPCFSQVSVNNYNRAIAEFNTSASEKDKLNAINLDALYADGYTAGDPSTYVSEGSKIASIDLTEYEKAVNNSLDDVSKEDMKSTNVLLDNTGTMIAPVTAGTIGSSISENIAASQSNGFTVGGKVGLVGSRDIAVFGNGARTTGSFEITGGGGKTWTSIETTGTTYSATYTKLPDSAVTGTDSSGNKASDYSFIAKMIKWEPEILGEKDSIILLDDTSEQNHDETIIKSNIPVIGYLVDYIKSSDVPAKIPGDLKVAATGQHTALLTWSNPDVSVADRTNQRPTPFSYEVFVSKDNNTYTSAGTVAVDQENYNKEVKFLVDQLDAASTYYFKLVTYAKDSSGNVIKSVKGVARTGKTKAADGPVITTVPEDCYAAVGDTPNFEAEAQAAQPGNTLQYQWQQLVETPTGYNWTNVTEDKNSQTVVFNPAYYNTGKVIGQNDVNNFPLGLNGAVYRCQISEIQSGYAAKVTYTRAVRLYIGDNKDTAQREAVKLTVSVNSSGMSDEENTIDIAQGQDTDIQVKAEDGNYEGITNQKVTIFLTKNGALLGEKSYVSDGNGLVKTTLSEITQTFNEEIEAAQYALIAYSEVTDTHKDGYSEIMTINVLPVHNINYDLGSNAQNADSNPSTYTTASGILTLGEPIRDGYTFKGWYYDKDYEKKVTDNQIDFSKYNQDLTLYAKWETITYTITYTMNTDAKALNRNPTAYTIEDNIALSPAIGVGYTFEGWYYDKDLTNQCYTISKGSTGNFTLYAKWSDAVKYSISYNLEGGVNNAANPTSYTIKDGKFTLKDAARDGYAFKGWYLNYSGTKKQTQIHTSTEDVKDIVLFAKWEEDDSKHSYTSVLTKATTSKNGSIVKTCEICGYQKTTIIYYPKTITLSKTSYTYNGKSQKPSVSVKGSDGKTIAASNYTVTYLTSYKKVGNYTVKIAFKGNYSGSVSKTYTINKKSITGMKASLSKTSYVYNNTTKTPKVTLKNGSTTLVKNTDYTVTYKNNKKVGTASVIIQGKGNYTGTLTKTFKINPKAVSFTKMSNISGKKIQLTWKKVSGVTGYKIAYSESKTFKKATTKTVAATNKTTMSKVLSGFSKNKTYYIRIRTYQKVGKTSYYSSWSSSNKSVKIQK